HLTDLECLKMRREWVGQIAFASFSSKARRVLILIWKNLSLHIQEMHSDQGSRFVILQAPIQNKAYMLVSLYAPNRDDSQFIKQLAHFLPLVVIGGDLNCILDVLMHRLPARPQEKFYMAESSKNQLQLLGISDVWRFLNPTKKFSFYSHIHKSYSRINTVSASNQLLHKMKDAQYQSRSISDHSPIIFKLEMNQVAPGIFRWCFNHLLLNQQDFQPMIREAISEFLNISSGLAPYPQCLWDSLKAYLQGIIISSSAKLKESFHNNYINAELKLRKVETGHAKYNIPETCSNLVQSYEAEWALLHMKATYYGQNNKARKLLAWQIQKEATSRLISKIYTSQDQCTTDPEVISSRFAQFYNSLYTS
uniref:Endonuclease/exonuclease/phosphatase domain-containing protein n=1 Tax=Latimeria chalumnae TaxID=7897 RepID=H2ZYV6_LATCH